MRMFRLCRMFCSNDAGDAFGDERRRLRRSDRARSSAYFLFVSACCDGSLLVSFGRMEGGVVVVGEWGGGGVGDAAA